MSVTRQVRGVPQLAVLPRPIWARPESWGDEGSITEWHQHAWGQFSYAAEGILKVKTPEVEFVAPPHYGIWIPAGVQHQVVSEGAAKMRGLYVQAALMALPSWQRPLVCEISPLCRELLIRFCQLPLDYDEHSAHGRLAQVLLDELQQQRLVELELPMPSDKRLAIVCEQLQRQPGCRWGIDQLGAAVGLSGRSVSRLFKLQTGMTFQHWRQRLRIIHALALLQQHHPVTDVAFVCGYDSISAFGEAFKAQLGRSPGQFFG